MSDLIIEELTVEYDAGGYPVRPLDGFDAVIEDGALAVLLGPSGCGKTTLLSCLGGILTPTSGSIRLGDRQLVGRTESELTAYRQREVGIVFQAFNLVPSLTATENVMAPLVAAGISYSTARQRAIDLLVEVDLAERLDHRPVHLSGGQQQRVALARALAHDPPLIIADEPTANLDYVQVEGVLRLLRRLATRGRIVVVATHDERLLPLADTVIEMVPKFHEDNVEPITERLSDGEILFEQGSRGNRIYVIESGSIEIIREHNDGPDELRATLGSGEYFGEMGPLFRIARSATARAAGDTVVIGYTTEHFRERVGMNHLADLVRVDPPQR